MKSTGIVRKIDELGRVVLPMEMRKILDIKEKDSIEISTDGERIILTKYLPAFSAAEAKKSFTLRENASVPPALKS